MEKERQGSSATFCFVYLRPYSLHNFRVFPAQLDIYAQESMEEGRWKNKRGRCIMFGYQVPFPLEHLLVYFIVMDELRQANLTGDPRLMLPEVIIPSFEAMDSAPSFLLDAACVC